MLSLASVIIGLCNPKSPSNVGGVMRAARCYGVDAVRFTGVRYARAAKFQTDTKNAISHIPLQGVEALTDDVPEGMAVVCVEFASGATALPEFKHPPRALYLFGPEDASLGQDVLDAADAVVFIPTIGCMNLAATVNVVLYDRLAKSGTALDLSAAILSNRDVNNRLRVKPRE